MRDLRLGLRLLATEGGADHGRVDQIGVIRCAEQSAWLFCQVAIYLNRDGPQDAGKTDHPR
jgi:hypothetical protein